MKAVESRPDRAAAQDVEVGAVIYRGPNIEATHYASIAVVDGRGRLTHYLGDPSMVTMMRSAIKPFQAAPLVMSGGAERFGYQNHNLSIMAGSHSGTDSHVAVILENLAKAGNDRSMLRCGAHWPIGMQQAKQYPTHGEDRDPVRHNCSGKHTGFLALARHFDVDPGRYLDPDTESQRMVKRSIAEYCEYDAEKMAMGIDGCSAPNYPLPLANLALGFMRLAGASGGNPADAALRRMRQAMMEYPVLFSGDNRIDYNLMHSFPGRLVCKGGAESLQAIGLSDPPMGIAVKIHDGNERALGQIVVELLRQLGLILDMGRFPLLKRYDRPEVHNAAGLVTGYIVPAFEIRKAPYVD